MQKASYIEMNGTIDKDLEVSEDEAKDLLEQMFKVISEQKQYKIMPKRFGPYGEAYIITEDNELVSIMGSSRLPTRKVFFDSMQELLSTLLKKDTFVVYSKIEDAKATSISVSEAFGSSIDESRVKIDLLLDQKRKKSS